MVRNRLEKFRLFSLAKECATNRAAVVSNRFSQDVNKYNSMDYIKIKAICGKALKKVLPGGYAVKGTSECENVLDIQILKLVYFFSLAIIHQSTIMPRLEPKSKLVQNLVYFGI
ncbi:MAG TPA: hypothetical protein CFH81_00355 [Sulfurovum sp. UBA12169]|nr:MAG TPA: hypothetical protein CFH81_00355 [Sulfurovum sp. UBA12169]